jgi:hypothetical protein
MWPSLGSSVDAVIEMERSSSRTFYFVFSLHCTLVPAQEIHARGADKKTETISTIPLKPTS